MTGQLPTIDPRDPRRHIYLELRARQILGAVLRGKLDGLWNMAWIAAASEFTPTAFALDAVTRMPTLLREALDDDVADELAARILEPITQYLMGALENIRADGLGAEPAGDIGPDLGNWSDPPPWLDDGGAT
jgi:hypothetical protein